MLIKLYHSLRSFSFARSRFIIDIELLTNDYLTLRPSCFSILYAEFKTWDLWDHAAYFPWFQRCDTSNKSNSMCDVWQSWLLIPKVSTKIYRHFFSAPNSNVVFRLCTSDSENSAVAVHTSACTRYAWSVITALKCHNFQLFSHQMPKTNEFVSGVLILFSEIEITSKYKCNQDKIIFWYYWWW